MTFVCTPKALEYMQSKKNNTILVEVVEATTSDLEIVELSIRLPDAKTKEIFLTKRGYRSVPTDFGEVLLPPFPLKFQDIITFDVKKFLFVTYLIQKGISTGTLL